MNRELKKYIDENLDIANYLMLKSSAYSELYKVYCKSGRKLIAKSYNQQYSNLFNTELYIYKSLKFHMKPKLIDFGTNWIVIEHIENDGKYNENETIKLIASFHNEINKKDNVLIFKDLLFSFDFFGNIHAFV